MKVLNIGSLNLDYVYSVDHMVKEGETLAAHEMETFCGGKGLNQSIALAKAGAEVFHAGLIGEDGDPLLEICRENGVRTDYIRKIPGKSGHTIIQVDQNAGNCILVYGGSNRAFTEEYVQEVLSGFEKGDILLVQNEINLLGRIVELAAEKGMTIFLNPSPMDERIREVDLSKISVFLVNEIEGGQITGQKETDAILSVFREKYPEAAVVLTLGKDGAVYQDSSRQIRQEAYPVRAVDTTAAGDTFTGYFIAGWLKGQSVEACMNSSAAASGLAVSRKGAAASIPSREETERISRTI